MSTKGLSLDPAQSVAVPNVGGDLKIQGWDRPELDARGDGVRVDQREGVVDVSSRGDLHISMPRGAHLDISMVGGDALIQDLDQAVIVAVVGGDLLLRNLMGAVAVIGPVGGDTKFENVAQVSVAGGQISGHAQRVAEEARRKAERQQRRAEERLRQVDKKMERARARTGGDFGSWLWRRKAGIAANTEANERVSDEERMTILKMLQDKKITSAQADTLFAALEGEQESPQASGAPSDEAGS